MNLSNFTPPNENCFGFRAQGYDATAYSEGGGGGYLGELTKGISPPNKIPLLRAVTANKISCRFCWTIWVWGLRLGLVFAAQGTPYLDWRNAHGMTNSLTRSMDEILHDRVHPKP